MAPKQDKKRKKEQVMKNKGRLKGKCEATQRLFKYFVKQFKLGSQVLFIFNACVNNYLIGFYLIALVLEKHKYWKN